MTTTERMQQRAVLILVAFGVIAALVVLLFHWEEPIPPSFADGIYASPTCGKLELKVGQLDAGKMFDRFTYWRRKTDIAVLPKRRVYIDRTAADGRCRVMEDGSTPSALPLGSGNPPEFIEIDDQKGDWVRFDRVR